MSVPDHYSTLGIKSDASDKEIKQAFWRLAKKFHPDKNPGNEKVAEQKFRQILTSYKVLINPESRNIYDRILKASRNGSYNGYKENLFRKAKKDLTYQCRLILLELLNNNSRSALEIYEGLISKIPYFSFDPYMNDADIRDCEFLLAEAYHQTGRLSEAAWLYEKVLERERNKAYFRGFAQEIKLLLKDVYIQRINQSNSAKDILTTMEKILVLELSKHETARVYKKAAEAYYRVNDINNSIRALRQAFQIDPKLSGAKRISKKLGMEQ